MFSDAAKCWCSMSWMPSCFMPLIVVRYGPGARCFSIWGTPTDVYYTRGTSVCRHQHSEFPSALLVIYCDHTGPNATLSLAESGAVVLLQTLFSCSQGRHNCHRQRSRGHSVQENPELNLGPLLGVLAVSVALVMFCIPKSSASVVWGVLHPLGIRVPCFVSSPFQCLGTPAPEVIGTCSHLFP